MDRVYQANVSSVPTTPPEDGSYGFVQSDAPLPSFNPTEPGPFFFHYVTESFLEVITAAGLTPDASNLHQLFEAVQILAASAPPPPPPPTPTPPPPASPTLYVYDFDTDTHAAFAVGAFTSTAIGTDATRLRSTAQAEFGAGSFQLGTPAATVSPLPFPAMSSAGLTSQAATLEFSTNRLSFSAGWTGPVITVNEGDASQLIMRSLTNAPPNYEFIFDTPSHSNITGGLNVATSVWTRWAITFDLVANKFNVFKDGTALLSGGIALWGSGGIWPSITSSAAIAFDVAFGAMDVTGHTDQVGYVDEVRLSSAVLYTEDYTPSSGAFPLA